MKKTLALIIGICLLSILAQAASIQVTWNANTETDLAGYKVYTGTAPGQYGAPITVTAPSYTFQEVTDKTTYYIAVSAFDTSGNESIKSEEVSVFIPDSTPPTKPTGLMQRLLAWLKGIFGGLA